MTPCGTNLGFQFLTSSCFFHLELQIESRFLGCFPRLVGRIFLVPFLQGEHYFKVLFFKLVTQCSPALVDQMTWLSSLCAFKILIHRVCIKPRTYVSSDWLSFHLKLCLLFLSIPGTYRLSFLSLKILHFKLFKIFYLVFLRMICISLVHQVLQVSKYKPKDINIIPSKRNKNES